MGGLSKKAYQFTRHSQKSTHPVLTLDAGSLLFKSNSINNNQLPQAKITAKGIVKSYNLTGYDAVGVSGRDLAAGLDFLLELQEGSQFDWLSANIISKINGKPLFKPAISRKIGDLKIGVVGLTRKLPTGSKLLGSDTVIQPWQEALPAIINRLTGDHDFIILLTNLSARECREIAEGYPAINLILHAQDSDSGQLPTNLATNTIMASTGKKGKYIGIMDIKWYLGSTWQDANHRLLHGKKKERARLTGQLALLKDRPQRNYTYQKVLNSLKVIENTIIKMEQARATSAKNDGPLSSYQNKMVPMATSMPDHDAVLGIVREIKLQGNSLNRPANATMPDNKLKNKEFTGWKACLRCHSKQVKTWQKTRHASSFLTLVSKNQQFNLDCLPCHVTGVSSKDPAAAIGMPSDRQVVGCENCHGSGASHSLNPTANQTTSVTASTCLTCHTPDHDGSFDFTKDAKKIRCPPDGDQRLIPT